MKKYIALLCVIVLFFACSSSTDYDVVIRNGLVYNGSGGFPLYEDIAVKADTIAAIGDLREFTGKIDIDADGFAVSPGFINMLSWATTSLIEDGRSQSDIRQGVTLEVFGEGWSEGPLNETMKKEQLEQQGDIKYDITWTTLSEYLDHLVERGVSTNVASFVGATTVRIHEIGYEDRPPTPQELENMKNLVRQAMEGGAVGLASALIYTPAFYAETDELVELAKVASEYGGMYISHIRSEGNKFLEAVDELITVAREANIPAEIYHFKAAGRQNWDKLDEVVKRIEEARAEGLHITADMYTYTAGSTGLDAAMPPWVQEGGHNAWIRRLKDEDIKKRVIREMSTPTDDWENLYLMAGPENVLLVGFKNEDLKPLTGKTLAAVAEQQGKSPEETAIDLVIQDDSRVGAVYFLMSEDNIRKKIAQPWMSFCSDAGSMAPESVFLKSSTHPRAYGCFARLLGRYVREEGVITLREAVRRLTSFPASNLKIKKRGMLKVGNYADIVIFNPDNIIDNATYDRPQQYAVGVIHVFVNGIRVIKDGKHTGAKPGRVVRGPGWTGWK
ncbi:aminoacylase [bacterium SM23_31]|nr:MAG: aminoacylase [bacterium SM23_31]